MKFEKVSLQQFTKDYMLIKYGDRAPSETEQEAIKAIWENIKLPKRSTINSAGYDFFMPYDQFFSQVDAVTIPTGIRFKCNPDKFLMCVPRSGLGFKYGAVLSNGTGIIDADYYNSSNEGHIMCKIVCREHFNLETGKAFMQGLILPYFKVENDNATEVRDGGFGSTGM